MFSRLVDKSESQFGAFFGILELSYPKTRPVYSALNSLKRWAAPGSVETDLSF
jgi:hypothetical protein